jgi:hypothetical protein
LASGAAAHLDGSRNSRDINAKRRGLIGGRAGPEHRFDQEDTTMNASTAAPKAHSFTAALCGFVGSTVATTMVLVLISGF